jgi:hypothetical protein
MQVSRLISQALTRLRQDAFEAEAFEHAKTA